MTASARTAQIQFNLDALAATVAGLGAGGATDVELAAAVNALNIAIAAKQNASTAATDAELAVLDDAHTEAEEALAVLIATKQDAASAASDVELAAARADLEVAIAAKQDASLAATDVELAALENARVVAEEALAALITLKQDAATAATDAELTAAVAALNASIALQQPANTAATDIELVAAVALINAAMATDSELSVAVAAEAVLRTSGDSSLDSRLLSVESGRVFLPPYATYQDAADALTPGDILDFGGATLDLDAAITVSADRVTLDHGELIADEHPTLIVTGDDVVCESGMRFERSVDAAADDTAQERSSVVVSGKRFKWRDCEGLNANLAVVYANGTADDLSIQGGSTENNSLRQDAAGVLGAVNSGGNNKGWRIGSGFRATGPSPLGIAIYNPQDCVVDDTVEVSGMRELARLTMTGWVAQGTANVWKTPDRLDGSTSILLNNGVHLTALGSVDPATLTSGQFGYGDESGTAYLYVSLGATNPNSRTMESGIVSGYGGMFYVVDADSDSYDNVFDAKVEDTDGIGVYFQFGVVSDYNNRTRSTCRNVAQAGQQNLQLPWAGIGLSGGLDTLCEGRVYTSGAKGVWAVNGATGIIDSIVRDAADVEIVAAEAGMVIEGQRNVVTARQTADFQKNGATSGYEQLGTVAPALYIAADGRLRVRIDGVLALDGITPVLVRLNVNAGEAIEPLGQFLFALDGGPLVGEAVFAGLAAGTKTVTVEFSKAAAGSLYLRGATQTTLERLHVELEELPA